MLSGAWCGAMGVGGWVLMATFWLAFLALAVWAVSRIFPRAPSGAPAPPATEPMAPAPPVAEPTARQVR